MRLYAKAQELADVVKQHEDDAREAALTLSKETNEANKART